MYGWVCICVNTVAYGCRLVPLVQICKGVGGRACVVICAQQVLYSIWGPRHAGSDVYGRMVMCLLVYRCVCSRTVSLFWFSCTLVFCVGTDVYNCMAVSV